MSSTSTSAALYAVVSSPAQLMPAVPDDAKDKAHHASNGRGFVNPWASFGDWGVLKIMTTLLWRKITGKENKPDTTPPTVPVRKPVFLPTRETPCLRATWLGHACYYVEFPGGLRVLFDPVFEERCSPFTFMGPKRYTPQPCQVEEIPTIDAIVISHSHYDHLSYPTIKRIHAVHPRAHFFVPLRLKQWFIDSGVPFENITELDWWESRDFTLTLDRSSTTTSDSTAPPSGKRISETTASSTDETASSNPQRITATFSCLPSQHMSARSGFDKAKTLWASWSISSGSKNVWFGGDTGYRAVPSLPPAVDDYSPPHDTLPHCPAFAQIGSLRGPFDLGLVPIGAYSPRSVMSPVHANPFDSVNIFVDTRCKRALGMHWGTWVLTDEDVWEPPAILRKALKGHGIAETGVFDVVDIGESREF